MAIRFDAIGDRLRTTIAAGQPPGTVFTGLCWAYMSVDRNAFSCPMSIDDNTDGDFPFTMSTGTDGTTLSAYSSNYGATVGAVGLSVATWYRLAKVRNGTAVSLYTGAAGSALAVASGTLSTGTGVSRTTIGSAWDDFWNGRLAGVKFWNVALTQAEIEYEFALCQPTRLANILRFHPFIVNETPDYSGNAADLTAGTATVQEDGPPQIWSRHLLAAA